MSPQRRLRIAAWERYMAVDHGSLHSMTCFSRFWFSGSFDQDRFSQAVLAVATRQPLLATKLTGSHWTPIPFDPTQQIDWHDSTVPIAFDHLASDDFRVRISVREGPLQELGFPSQSPNQATGVLVVITFHHALSDGIGAVRLMAQISAAYEARTASETDREDFDYRLHLGLTTSQRLGRLPSDSKRIAAYLHRWPRQAKGTAGERDEREIHSRSLILSAESVHDIRLRCRQKGIQVNDVLISALLRSIANRLQRGTIRLAVPVSFRPKSHLGFCNLVSMVFLDRSVSQTKKPNLLSSVAREMHEIKSKQMAHSMSLFLKLACLGRGKFLSLFLRSPKTETTAVLTNLGHSASDHDGVSFDSAKLQGHDVLVPLRPKTNLAMSASETNGQILLTLRFNGKLFSDNDIEALFAEFPNQIADVLVSDR
ncbi:Condensation domain protein [Roseimaritima multifibrata]|uniref:Condensation domain protein n=1 Tax=Roseimaritima multifibrata TaxID=1930274 RepID=A0A517ML62_9BACT|nr:condensation domain-containing protein [Roseimaritima multifibrata]QDS95628.1 Condensation domain protein [Roseimaritima multifibrata]